MWASLDEADARFQAETLATYDFRVRDRWDNGEFLTGATVDLYERGKVVHTETFVASSEDAPLGGFSAYGNGRETTLEERLAPVGPEWEREMAEAR
jgi:hypothetical protein